MKMSKNLKRDTVALLVSMAGAASVCATNAGTTFIDKIINNVATPFVGAGLGLAFAAIFGYRMVKALWAGNNGDQKQKVGVIVDGIVCAVAVLCLGTMLTWITTGVSDTSERVTGLQDGLEGSLISLENAELAARSIVCNLASYGAAL